MKQIVLLLIIFSSYIAQAQDTLSHTKRYKGGETTLLIKDQDTFFSCTYPNGKLESIRPYSMTDKTTIYKRYYENGKRLWDREMVKGQANGTTIFYNERGKAVASLVFKNDSMIDTNFISLKHQFVYGRGTYFSKVYGGMQREDGSSNISERHGTYMYSPMYTVKLDTSKVEQTVYKDFFTDYNGYYFICLEKGNFGFFPSHMDVKKINAKIGSGQSGFGGGIDYTWNGGPILIDDQNLHILNLHSHSVGYAP